MSGQPGPPPAARLGAARALAARRDWPALARLAREEPDALPREPELGYLYADALWRVGEPGPALALAERLRAPVDRSGNRRLRLRLVNLMGMVHFQLADYARADAWFHELLALATELGDDEFVARAANNLGILAFVHGQRDRALASYQRALASYQRLGHERGLAQTHHNLGLAYRALAFVEDADAHFQRAVLLGDRAESQDIVAAAEAERALLLAQQGDGQLAETLAMRALHRFERLGDPSKRGEVLRVLAAAARAQFDDARAEALLAEALELCSAYPNPLLEAELLRDRALLLRDRGATAEAQAGMSRAAELFADLGATAEAEEARSLLLALGPPPGPASRSP